MTALAQSVRIGLDTYAAGTDHTAMPVAVVDQIRNPNAWVGGAVPALSAPRPAGDAHIIPADLVTPTRGRAALGLGNSATRNVGAVAGTVAAGDDSRFGALQTALDSKAGKGDLVVRVEDYAVGNANYLSAGIWYADAALTTVATDDTAAIRALVTAGAKHLSFGSRRYRIQWTQGTSFLSWASTNGIALEGYGAVLCDTGTYTVSPANPYSPVFEFDACANVAVTGIDYVGPAIASPLANHGYVGSTFVRAKNGCQNVVVDAAVTNARYGVESGSYPSEAEGYNKNLGIRLRCSFVGYPMAHYLAEGVRFDIDADDVHRVAYVAGCRDITGVARWKNEYVADTCFLITDAKTGTGTSRGCSDLDVVSIDKGSTVFQASTACAGIGLSRVDPGITYENIKVRVHTTSTDILSSTVGGFKLYSGAASLTTPPASFNWEPTITLRNISVSGMLDHSAQTIDGNTAGDIFVRTWDTSAAHAATVENLSFRDFIVKPSSGNTRGLYLECPTSINNGLLLENVQAPGYQLNLYTSATTPLTIRNSCFAELIGGTAVPRLIMQNSTINKVSGTITGYDSLNTSVSGGGCFLRQKSIELTLTGSAVTWTSAIPAGCLPLGVSGLIMQTVTGATGVLVGVGVDTGRYLNTNTLTAGFGFGPSNQSVTEQTLWWAGPSTLNINVTAKTSNFTGGKLKLVLNYLEFPAPTS